MNAHWKATSTAKGTQKRVAGMQKHAAVVNYTIIHSLNGRKTGIVIDESASFLIFGLIVANNLTCTLDRFL